MDGSEKFKTDGSLRGHHCGAGGPVDMWLRDALASTYDPVLTEPLPESWMRLIRASAGDYDC